MRESGPLLLSINTGSSSLKLGVYRNVSPPQEVLSKSADGLLQSVGDAGPASGREGQLRFDPAGLLDPLIAKVVELGTVVGVAHRLVHGGVVYRQPCRIDAQVRRGLEKVVPLAPNHLPQALAAIDYFTNRFPEWPQVACFDTAFHRDIPRRARTFGLNSQLADEGLIRFGFHGLSYEYLVETLHTLEPDRVGGRAVLAHLGNGASMAAVERGTCIDTSMGFTPTGGLVMGTRSGDLDPGILVYLLQNRGLAPADLGRMLDKQSGLLGLSGTTADMRELLARRATDSRADAAVELFCYQAKKFLAGYAAALGGLDTVVFTGGIGEHAAPIRAEICQGLEFLGLALDSRANAAHRPVISSEKSAVVVRVIPTNEDLMIAQHAQSVLQAEPATFK